LLLELGNNRVFDGTLRRADLGSSKIDLFLRDAAFELTKLQAVLGA